MGEPEREREREREEVKEHKGKEENEAGYIMIFAKKYFSNVSSQFCAKQKKSYFLK